MSDRERIAELEDEVARLRAELQGIEVVTGVSVAESVNFGARGRWPVPRDWDAHVRQAYVCVRQHDSTIPDQTLDLMRDVLLAAGRY